MRTLMFFLTVFFTLCVCMPQVTIGAEREEVKSQHLSVPADKTKLTKQQRAQLDKILKEAAPILKEKRHSLRVAEKNYAKAVAEGSNGQSEKVQAVAAYEELLDAEMPVRKELKAAGLPADIPLGKRPNSRRTQKGQKTEQDR